MDWHFPIVVGEVNFNNTIFWYPAQLGTLWIWLTWKILFPTSWTKTHALFKATIYRHSSDISSVSSWLQQILGKYAGKGGFLTASNSCSGISGTDSDRGCFRDYADFLRKFTLFPKHPCWCKTAFVLCYESFSWA